MFVGIIEIREHLPLIDPLLAKHNLSINGISYGIMHPGEAKVFQYIELEFGFGSWVLEPISQILAKIGNILSGKAIYILDKFLTSQA